MAKIAFNRIILSTCIIALVCFGWVFALTSKLRIELKQNKLVTEANSLLKQEIYQQAVSNLQQALVYKTNKNEDIYLLLANTYKKIGYNRKYAYQLSNIINLNTQNEGIYYQLATYYFDNYRYHDCLNTLQKGIKNLNSSKLKEYYEQVRYKTYYLFCYPDEVQPFSEGYAAVKLNNKWGYLDRNGKLVIDYKFDKATPFNNKLALVINNGKTSIIAKNGFNSKVAEFISTDLNGFSENGAAVKIKDEWKIVNDDFAITTESWQELGSYNNNIIAVKQKGLWGFRQKGGKMLLDYQYKKISLNEKNKCFINDTCFISVNNSYRLIDIKGKYVSENRWQDAKAFNEQGSYAAVKNNEKWGFINSKGDKIIDFLYDDAKSFSNNLAAVKINKKWGFINSEGKLVIGAIYDDVQSFYNGLAGVKKDNSWRFLGLEQYRHKNNFILDSLGGLK